jgi:2-polyprenyl-3-methyl-5-hydroxy-6-metoxy-1,4-benzoquinol methylase
MHKNSITHSEMISRCLITGEPVSKILDFGQHAYADTFVAETQLNLSEPVFPLQVYLCPESGSIQLGYVSHAEDRYNLYSYSYTSSNSATARAHWDEYSSTVQGPWNRPGMAVEIGSNDGYLIEKFGLLGRRILGIDSSRAMCDIAEARGVSCINALFDQSIAQQVIREHGPAQIVMANNVFNHANDPVAFARAVAHLLDTDDGIFVFEVPYWLSMIESGRFTDMVYHEHPTYWTVKMAWNVLQAAELEIVNFDVVDYHGGSLRVFARRNTGAVMPVVVEDAIARETQIGLFDPVFYETMQRRFEQQRDAWLQKFYELRQTEPDAVFIGVGAAAKANTWLTWHGLNKTHLKYVTDASAFKQGKYTPLSRIPIADDAVFAQYDRPFALILSWNIGEGLKRAILNINPNTRFISQ